jgi:hypothetical protein
MRKGVTRSEEGQGSTGCPRILWLTIFQALLLILRIKKGVFAGIVRGLRALNILD